MLPSSQPATGGLFCLGSPAGSAAGATYRLARQKREEHLSRIRTGGAALLAACVALAGCGGGGSDAPPLPPLPTVQPLSATACTPTGTAVRIQLFGDSTQAGAIAGGMAAKTPTMLLQADMDATFGAGAVLVEDRAASSTSAAQLLAGTDGKNAPWPQSVAADIVVINHGINDAGRGVLPATYRSQIDQIVAAAPARVVLETPNPTRGQDMAPFAQAMREVAATRGATVADTYAYVSSLPEGGLEYLSDWAHPTQELYAHIVRNSLMPALTPLVKAKACR